MAGLSTCPVGVGNGGLRKMAVVRVLWNLVGAGRARPTVSRANTDWRVRQ